MKTSFLDNYFNHNPNFNPIRRQRDTLSHITINAKEQTVKKTVNFKQEYAVEDSSLEIDDNHGIVKIVWKGNVGVKAAKQIVVHCARAIQKGNKKLLIDQSNLSEFDTEARLWVKVFIKSGKGNVTNKLDMLASIKPKSTKGRFFSHFASNELKEALPSLQMIGFDSELEAINWLL